MRNSEHDLPPWIWRGLGFGAVGLLLATVLGIGLISAGVFDPRPGGSLQRLIAPGARTASTLDPRLTWLDEQLPQPPFTVRLLAAHRSGETDVGYGLALGAPHAYLAAGVSPLGYVTLWQEDGTGETVHMPWQTWPHVRPGSEPNEIQVDVNDGRVSVRLNRELLWQGPWLEDAAGIGLYTETFGAPTTVGFEQLSFFH